LKIASGCHKGFRRKQLKSGIGLYYVLHFFVQQMKSLRQALLWMDVRASEARSIASSHPALKYNGFGNVSTDGYHKAYG
jgi:hypothetical protein